MKRFVILLPLLSLSALVFPALATDSVPMPRRLMPPAVINRVVEQTIPDVPTDDDLRALQAFPEPLVPLDGKDETGERRMLGAALRAWTVRGRSEDHSALRKFLAARPGSRWSPSLRLNLGILSYQAGAFSLALENWRLAWEGSRASTAPGGIATANSAIANYCGMLSRIGRKKELGEALAAARDRTFQGAALQHFTAACEALSIMQNNPGISFRCGPFALASIQEKLLGKADPAFTHDIQSPAGGFSLAEVRDMAQKGGLHMVAARRQVGAPVLLPCVVHWKLDHYAALVEERGGRYLLKDPTFASQHWISQETLDQEASGAFLVPEQAAGLPKGWQAISPGDLNSIHGKGYVYCITNNGGVGTGTYTAVTSAYGTVSCFENKTPPSTVCYSFGMPVYQLLNIPCAVGIQDTPVAYKPAAGPSVLWRLSYNQRAVDQPSTLLFSNFGPLWSAEFTSYLEDDPGNLAANVTIHLRNGGFDVATYNSQTGQFNKEISNDTFLVRTSPGVYERQFRDGSKEVYGLATGSSGPRKVFLTQIVDATGLALTLAYDTDSSYPTRLKYIFDATSSATGAATQLFYEQAGQPYLITRVVDPFGRAAEFSYATLSGAVRLQKIRDAVGMESSFAYDDTGTINVMTTPYGSTKFSCSAYPNFPSSGAEIRYVEVTDPLGQKERIEFRTQDTFYGIPDAEALVPSIPGLTITNGYNGYRNVFFWGKNAMGRLGGSVSADPAASLASATIFHYLHAGSAASGVLESIKYPLESRIYYRYPGQGDPVYIGTSATWTARARIVEDGNGGTTTQLTRREVNSLGQITRVIDPVGRETTYEYDTNNIDLRFTRQKTGGIYQTIKEIQYDPSFPPHLPWKVIDVAGQPTTYAYNARKQVTSVTNALNETTSYTYGEDPAAASFAQLLVTTGAVAGATTTNTYDAAQRKITTTDSAGYTLTYDYDALDRRTRVTFPDGTYEAFDYDRLDVGTSRDRLGRITQFKHDALRQLILLIDPAQRVLQYDYCSCGSIKLFVDGNGNRTTWSYDVIGRKTAKRYADGKGDDFTYEPYSGRLSTGTDAKGQTKKTTYYADGAPRQLAYLDAQVTTPGVAYTYDTSFDRLSTVVDGIGTHTYTYYSPGELGALKVKTLDGPFVDPEPLTDLVTFTYDKLGRLKTRNIGPVGTENKVVWSYDALGRIESEVNNLCAAGTRFACHYDGTTPRLASIDYPNGQRALYDYWPTATVGQPGNGDFRLKQITNYGQNNDPATLLSRFSYTYDPIGNLLAWHREFGASATGETYTFGHDTADQLRSAVARADDPANSVLRSYHYTYDKSGNRLGKEEDTKSLGYTYNLLNQLTAAAPGGRLHVAGRVSEPAQMSVNGVAASVAADDTFEADVPVASGNVHLQVSAADFASPANTQVKTWTASLDNASAFKQTYDPNGNTVDSGDNRYIWDAANRPVEIDEEGVARRFLFDGLGRRVAEVSASGQTLKRWIWCGSRICEIRTSSQTDRAFERGIVSNGSAIFYTKDHLGSIRETCTGAGVLTNRWDYTPNGRRFSLFGDPQTPVPTPFGFTGHLHNKPDVVFAPFRTYFARTATWLSRDPLEETGGWNLYSYVHNRPLDLTDPMGLEPAECKPPGKYSIYKISGGQCKIVGPDSYVFGVFFLGPFNTLEEARAALNADIAIGESDPSHCMFKNNID